MKRWRWWAIGLTVWAVGCGGSSDDTEVPRDGGAGTTATNPPVTIAFLEHGNPSYGVANGVAFRNYQSAHPNVTIKVTTIDYTSLTATLLADLSNDRLAADLLQVPGNWVCTFASHLADVPADVISLSAAQEIFFAPPLAGSTCQGVLKGLPVEYNLEYGGVVLNVDKYQARFPDKAPAWPSWSAFIADAAALAEYDAEGTPRANGLDIDPNWPGAAVYIFLAGILQRGGQYWSASGGSFDLDTQAARDTLADMASWVVEDKVMSLGLIPQGNTFVGTRLARGTAGYGWGDVNRPLSLMGYLGSWGVATVRALLPPDQQNTRYDYFTLPPMVGNQHRFVTYGGWAFAVPRSSQNQRVAWDIARSLALDPAAMKQWSATTLALPALRENGSAAAVADNPTLARVQPLLEIGQYIGYMPAGAIQIMEGAILSNYFAVVRGTKTVDQALADMEQTINNAFAQYR